MAEGLAPFYTLSNYGKNMNCTLTAFFPAVVAIRAISIGGDYSDVNYDVSRRLFFFYSNVFFIFSYLMIVSLRVSNNFLKITYF